MRRVAGNQRRWSVWTQRALALVACVACGGGLPVAAQQPLAPESIQRSIEKARDWLIREQKADGSWECSMRTI